jgi:hypothetical protein
MHSPKNKVLKHYCFTVKRVMIKKIKANSLFDKSKQIYEIDPLTFL